MHDRIINLHQELLNKIRPELSYKQARLLERAKITFNSRLRTSLGRAYLAHNHIELNPTLLNEFPEEFEATFAHELAHLAAHMMFGKRGGGGHREGWQQVMKIFGYPPERTHRLPVGERRRFHKVAARAACGCDGFTHEIKPRRLRKMRYGRQRYRCLACRQELVLISRVS